MDKANIERTSYGAFERFLYFFLIPLIYSSVLVFVLFVIFNEDVRQSMLRTANNIPVIREIVPDPKEDQQTANGLLAPEIVQVQKEANQQLDAMKNELSAAIQASRQKEDEISALQAQIAELESHLEDKQLSADEYEQQIQSLSNMYADMNPKRSAPIIESLLPSEQVLIMSRMSTDEQVAVLERMNPQTAARVTMALKDKEIVDNAPIASLQERIKELEAQVADRSDALTREQLAETFAAMDSASAATVLLNMVSINENDVVAILRSMNLNARSQILSVMSNSDSDVAARLSSKLGG